MAKDGFAIFAIGKHGNTETNTKTETKTKTKLFPSSEGGVYKAPAGAMAPSLPREKRIYFS